MEPNKVEIISSGLKGNFSKFTKKEKKDYRTSIGEINNEFLKDLKVKEITNSLGQKLLSIFCPDCKTNHNFTKVENFIKHQKKYHTIEYNQSRLSVLDKIIEPVKVEPAKPKITKPLKPVDRTFYVDAALSVKSKEDKRYWKCSVVENDKNILNFVNSVVNKTVERNGKHYQIGTNSAEAYTTLKVIFYLIEQKWKGSVRIFTDNKFCSQFCKRNKNKVVKMVNNKTVQYLGIALQKARENNIDLNVDWIAGVDNPADYYSRH